MHIESCVYIHVMFMFFFGLIQLINFSEDFLQIMELCVFFFFLGKIWKYVFMLDIGCDCRFRISFKLQLRIRPLSSNSLLSLQASIWFQPQIWFHHHPRLKLVSEVWALIVWRSYGCSVLHHWIKPGLVNIESASVTCTCTCRVSSSFG